MITGKKLIDLLYLCEDSKEIQELEKELNIQRPLINKEFKEDGYVAIEAKSTRSEIFFSDISRFDKNIDLDTDCLMIFSTIMLYYKTTIPLPFALKMDDDLQTVLQKIGANPDYTNINFPTKTWHLQRDDGKDYLLYASFDEDDYQELISVTIKSCDYDTINRLSSNEFLIKHNA